MGSRQVGRARPAWLARAWARGVMVLLAVGIGAVGAVGSGAAAGAPAGAAVALPRMGGRLEGSGTVRFDHGTPRQDPQARLDFFLEDGLAPGLRWHASGIATWGGTVLGASGPGLIDLGRAVQNIDPSLELDEAYLESRNALLDVRVGKQKFSWGRLDVVQPNDLLNPRRYLDPFRTDEIDAKVATPALAASLYPPRSWQRHLPDEARVSLAWVPWFVPWRYPDLDERWFAPTARVAKPLIVDRIAQSPAEPGQMPVDPLCPCPVTLDQTVANSSAPARTLSNSTFGTRASGRTGDVDWAVVYFDGYDPTAAFTATVSDVALVPRSQGAPGLAATGRLDLRTAYLRSQSAGIDGATTLGPFALRFEGAFKIHKPYPRALATLPQEIADDPDKVKNLFTPGGAETVAAYARRNAIEWGAGADTNWHGFVPMLEVYQIALLNNDAPLLVRDVDTRLAVSLRKRLLGERLEAHASLVWGIEGGYEVGRVQASYALTDDLQLRFGVLAIAGSRSSLLGQFKRNGEAFARLRWSF